MSADPQDAGPRRRFPSSFYNTITLAGTALAAISLGLILFLMALEALSHEHKPYMGIIAFVILPGFLVVGLVVAAIGVLRQQRRRKLGLPSTDRLPRIDLNDPAQLRASVLVGTGGVLFLLLTGFGSFKAYEYTDSDQFCGTVCHEVMKPEYTAYQASPHARVGCVECHIGPGAEWFVRSKLSGAYQVYSVMFDKFSRPIETPIKNLRPSRDTCEQCHWPAHFAGEKMVIHDYFASEEGNDHWRLQLLMRIGGGGAGIAPAHGSHWHMAEEVEVTYVSTDDKREDIPWVRLRLADGTEKIYRDTEADFDEATLPDHVLRTMDCIDCHNRPTHHYNPPSRLVNTALQNGVIAADLPGIKGLLVGLMEADYATEDEALAAIDAGVRGHYLDAYPELAAGRGADLDKAVAAAQHLFKTNIFPEMRVSWRHFPDHIGHLTTDGCFRCHDGNHTTDEGETIRRDCNLCHTIVSQERISGDLVESLAGVEYQHPEDIGDDWKVLNCSECHGG
ncbi:MAG: NapC/NirT family cytochrome c [Krumholzibacteria bacterium]|nr:NapC/NirT family cytochrome c [Candidatus Krumholzibacteria bacterium]